MEVGDFGQNLRAVRLLADASLSGVAEKAGITRQWLAKVENGEGDPTISVFLRVCHALEVDPSVVLSIKGKDFKSRLVSAASLMKG